MGNEAKAAPLEEGSQFHGTRHRLERLDVALWPHHSRVLVLDLCPAFMKLLYNHVDGLHNIERLETGNHDRLVMLACNEIVRPHADHHTHVSCTDKTIQSQVGRVENSFHRRYDGHMIAEDREIPRSFGLCPQEGDGRRGGSRLKADGKEDHLPVGMLAGKFVGIERRIDEAHVGAIGLGVEETTLGARHAHHVTKGGEDYSIHTGNGNGVVDASHRQDADRAARPMNKINVARQHVFDAVLINSMGMPAADLHEFERLTGAQFPNLARNASGQVWIAVLVNIFHGNLQFWIPAAFRRGYLTLICPSPLCTYFQNLSELSLQYSMDDFQKAVI